jgi:hypothetical protein
MSGFALAVGWLTTSSLTLIAENADKPKLQIAYAMSGLSIVVGICANSHARAVHYNID